MTPAKGVEQSMVRGRTRDREVKLKLFEPTDFPSYFRGPGSDEGFVFEFEASDNNNSG
jgi:hypothetical protein